MRYDTYHNTHEVIFDMYQWYILSDFRPKINWYVHKFHGNFNDQNNLNLSKNVSFGVSCKLKWMIWYVTYSQSIDTTDISWYDKEP